MLRSLFARASLVVCLFAGCALAVAAPPRVVKVGVVRSLVRNAEPQLFQVVASTFSTVVKAQTGLDGELIAFNTPDDVRRGLENGELQLGVMYGVEFGWMKQKQPNLLPLMLNEIDPDALEGVVVVRHDSGVKSLKECRGKKVAIPATTRADTRLFLTQRCRSCGLPTAEMFGDTVTPPSIEEALDQVVDGQVAVAAVEQSGMKMFERRKPARFRRLHILEQSEKFPPSVIVYHRNKVDDAILAQFRDGMSTAHNSVLGSHLMKLMNVRQFAPAKNDFQHRVDQIVKLYPSPDDTITLRAFEAKGDSK